MPEVQGFETLKFEVEGGDLFIHQGQDQVHFPVDYLGVVIEQMKLAKKNGPVTNTTTDSAVVSDVKFA